MPKKTTAFDVLITNTTAFVKQELKGAEGGHDWFHVQRVYKNALLISENEKLLSKMYEEDVHCHLIEEEDLVKIKIDAVHTTDHCAQ